MTKHVPILILGAGPAGLTLSRELTRQGRTCLVLEKGSRAGESFAHYPRHIWFGPWLNNMLPGTPVPWTWWPRRATQPDYAAYLEGYAVQHALPIRFGVKVQQVSHDGHRFLVATSEGDFSCSVLVNATGYFSQPYLPEIPGLHESGIPVMHSRDYRESADLRRLLGGRRGKVLVVGQGLSAGEAMCELVRDGYQVGLSHRGKLTIGPSVVVETLLSPLTWVREQLAVHYGWRLNSSPPMAGGRSRELLSSGAVPTYPPMTRAVDGEIVFQDGRRDRFDAVLFCTGYNYAAGHLSGLLGAGGPVLKDGVESATVPGLFFLGLDQQRSFRSRFLRGLREDAEHLAARLLQLAPEPSVEVRDLRPGPPEVPPRPRAVR